MSKTLLRTEFLSQIPTYVTMTARIVRLLKSEVPLILDLRKIIMDYFEGMYSDEIYNAYKKLTSDLFNFQILCTMVHGFTNIKFNHPIEYETENTYLREIIAYLEIPFNNIRQSCDWYFAIRQYITSIDHINKMYPVTVYHPTMSMCNAIYILIYATMQINSNTYDVLDLPVWDIDTFAFVPYKQLRWIDYPDCRKSKIKINIPIGTKLTIINTDV